MNATTRYTLPAKFTIDWLERMDGLSHVPDMEALIVRAPAPKGTTIVLQLNDEQRRDLLADARHYADDGDDYWDDDNRALHKSAKRVVAAIQRQTVTA